MEISDVIVVGKEVGRKGLRVRKRGRVAFAEQGAGRACRE
jgi:hypothetical protein